MVVNTVIRIHLILQSGQNERVKDKRIIWYVLLYLLYCQELNYRIMTVRAQIITYEVKKS